MLMKEAGFNRFNMTPRKWIESTNAIGIVSKANYHIHTDAISPSSPTPTAHLTVIPGLPGDLMPNIILISLHVNAAGDGTKWMNATGWSCYTCKGQTESDIATAAQTGGRPEIT